MSRRPPRRCTGCSRSNMFRLMKIAQLRAKKAAQDIFSDDTHPVKSQSVSPVPVDCTTVAPVADATEDYDISPSQPSTRCPQSPFTSMSVEPIGETCSIQSPAEVLRGVAIDCRLSLSNINIMLHRLRPLLPSLPKDADSLMAIPKTCPQIEARGRKNVHSGLSDETRHMIPVVLPDLGAQPSTSGRLDVEHFSPPMLQLEATLAETHPLLDKENIPPLQNAVPTSSPHHFDSLECRMLQLLKQQAIDMAHIFEELRAIRVELAAIQFQLASDMTRRACPIVLPLNTIEGLAALNNQLQSRSLMAQLVNYFSIVGGTSVTTATRNIMKVAVTRDLARRVNWRGVSGKCCVYGTPFARSVIDAIVRMGFSDCRVQDIKEEMRRWFQLVDNVP